METSCHPDMLRFWQRLTEGWCAGQPLLLTLRVIQEELPPEPLGTVVCAMADDVEQGACLSAVVKRQPSVFTQAHVSLIEGGELLGIVDRVLLLILEATWRCPSCGNLQFPSIRKQEESLGGR